eukprot:451612-Pyramimonas_sp.AAC.1
MSKHLIGRLRYLQKGTQRGEAVTLQLVHQRDGQLHVYEEPTHPFRRGRSTLDACVHQPLQARISPQTLVFPSLVLHTAAPP